MIVKFSKQRLLELAGLGENTITSPGANAFRQPGHVAQVNQAQEVEHILNGKEDTVPSDEPEDFEHELLSLDFD